MKILITYALEAERGSWMIPGHELLFCRTGVGKVSAALQTYETVLRLKPDLVMAVGSAGTLHHRVGDILLCNHFIDRDLEKIAYLGVPFELDFTDELSVFLLGDEVNACVSTGDTFQTDETESAAGQHADVFDMEAFGSAQACKQLNIPFLAIKYVTDVIGQNSLKHWEEKLEDARKSLEKYLEKVIID
jgi:adenosylhomocysteine nucleosidase